MKKELLFVRSKEAKKKLLYIRFDYGFLKFYYGTFLFFMGSKRLHRNLFQ